MAPAGDATQASPKGTGVFTGSAQLSARTSFHDTQDTIYTLAADTGGKALLDSNDLTLGIKAVQTDINSYYVLGYYSANPAQDGKYRHVTVKIAALPESAKIDYRNGYYAGKVWGKMNSSDKERQLEDALTLDDPFTDLPLAFEVDYFQTGRDKYFVPITVRISGSALDLSPKSSTDLDFIGQIRDLHGKLLGGVRDEIKLKLTEENAAQLAQRHVEYDTGVTLPPGDYNLRFLTRENQNGKMGTFEMKFTVPDLSKQSSSVRMSSVVWSNQREPLSASIGTRGRQQEIAERASSGGQRNEAGPRHHARVPQESEAVRLFRSLRSRERGVAQRFGRADDVPWQIEGLRIGAGPRHQTEIRTPQHPGVRISDAARQHSARTLHLSGQRHR